MRLHVKDLVLRRENGTAATLSEFHLDEDESVGWMGASGVGKSTLVRAILSRASKIHLPDFRVEGTVNCDFIRIGYQPQSQSLIPWITVRAMFEGLLGAHRQRSPADPGEIYDCFKLHKVLRQFPDQLSGGEYQRCALAAALLTAPDLLILDEPLTEVDFRLRTEILDYIHKFRSARKTSCLLISHDIDTVAFLADRLVTFFPQSPSPVTNHPLCPMNWNTWREFVESQSIDRRRAEIMGFLN